MSVAQKGMNADDVKGAFSSAVSANGGGSLADDGEIDTQSYLKQIQTGGEMDANALNQQRNGKRVMFDDPSNRGPAISAHAGQTPLSVEVSTGKH